MDSGERLQDTTAAAIPGRLASAAGQTEVSTVRYVRCVLGLLIASAACKRGPDSGDEDDFSINYCGRSISSRVLQ